VGFDRDRGFPVHYVAGEALMAAKKKNAGRYSKRKHKKFMKAQGFSGSDIQYVRRKKRTQKRSTRKSKNPTVYDASGKSLGKFSRKGAKIAARASGGTVGRSLVFRTKDALLNFAKTYGYRIASIRKAPR
jgi:hypothetical protein